MAPAQWAWWLGALIVPIVVLLAATGLMDIMEASILGAVTMVATRVFGNDATVGFAGSQGNFQLNVFKPVMAHAVLESIRLLADAARSFDEHCAVGLEPNLPRIAEHLDSDLMLVTALNPHIGYDKAAKIAKRAHAEGLSLREAAVASGDLNADQFDAWVVPLDMTHPGER